MTVLTLFAFRFGRMVRWLAGREAEGPWRGGQGRDEGLALVWRWFGVGLAASRRRLFPAIHLVPESAFQSPPGHISSRDGADLCPSRTANPSRQRSGAHSLARWFAGRLPKISDRPHTALRARLVHG